MKKYDAIIIGAGASGCMCAISSTNKNIAILDSSHQIAKKILVTGNGRCNLSNTHTDSSRFNRNIDKYLTQFSVDDTLDLFKSIGLVTYSDDMGRVYPISNSAKSVMDILDREVRKHADVYTNTTVTNITRLNDGFEIKTDTDTFTCNKVILATGGNTLQESLENMGINITHISPSLVALHTNSTKNLANVRISNVKVTATCNDNTMTDTGEVLFKDSGLSGIVSFNLSSLYARNHNFNGNISIDLLPDITDNELSDLLHDRKLLNVSLSKYFVGLFQNQVADEILRQSKLNTNINSKNLTGRDIDTLISTIRNLTFIVDGYYDNNQVYSGGISLENLSDTLEYNNIPHLYLIGEICDVDGECGGYNLQWAWTSGHIVGDNL